MINPRIFRAYDIRGIAHKPASEQEPDLTPETMALIGKAAGSYYKRHYGTNIALGRDARLSTPELSQAFIEALLSTGCDVTLIGQVPSPMMYFSVCHFGFDGGVMITASHNPKEYNGVKLVGRDAHSICGDEIQVLLQMIQNEDFDEGQGELKELDPFPAYQEKLKSMIRLERPMKVVLDAANGVAGPFMRPLFEKLGCEVITLFEDPDGNFPNHEANPEEEENMHDLAEAVLKHQADFGIGFDGDGDRVGIVDENGQHYNADLLLLLLAQDALSRHPGRKVIFDVKSSQVLIDGVAEAGGEPVMSKTGHSFIETQIRELKGLIGGEISGHIFFAEDYYGFDDAFLAAARLIEFFSKSDAPVSSYFAALPQTACTPELKTPCPDDRKFDIVDDLTKRLKDQYECKTIDGIRLNYDAKSWAAVRCSNTSPNLTIRFEAPDFERLHEIMGLMVVELKRYPELELWWEGKRFDQDA